MHKEEQPYRKAKVTSTVRKEEDWIVGEIVDTELPAPELVKCPSCDYEGTKMEVKNHIRSHQQDKLDHKAKDASNVGKKDLGVPSEYKCHRCDMIFYSEEQLHLHLQREHGEVPRQ